MWEKIFSNTVNIVVIMALSIPIIAVIGYYWHEVLKNRSNNELKKSMLERGMSAQEIEQVINAGIKQPEKK
jgi:NADH:ubiquinone oxidoreductase subunit 3 (subunit A)